MEEHSSEAAQKFLAIARVCSVYFFLVFLLLLNAARIPLIDLGNVSPFFLLMGIYYWILTRPSLLPHYLVFLFGLSLDFLSAQVVGTNGLAFLIISFVLHGQRRFLKGQSWPVIWVGYGIACLFVAFCHIAVYILMNWDWPGLATLFATVLVSVLAYPVTLAPMIGLQRLLR